MTYIPTTLIDRTFREKIVLVGVLFPGNSSEELDDQLDELEELVNTAGADVKARVIQRRDSPDPATFLGSGKVQELKVYNTRPKRCIGDYVIGQNYGK